MDETLFHAAAGALQRHARAQAGGAEPGLGAATGSSGLPTGDALGEVPGVLEQQRRLVVLWKPPGWSINVADDSGLRWEQRGSERPLEAWLEEEFGERCPIVRDADASHGLIHRLDKDTSGPLLWAPCYSGFYAARLHFRTQRVRKEYVCLCWGWLRRDVQSFTQPLLRVESGQASWSIVAPQGKTAATDVSEVAHLTCIDGHAVSLVEVRLRTGRLHQIRAHLSHAGHPLVGDVVYKGEHSQTAAWCPRVFLHACRLCIDIGDGLVDASVGLPADLRRALAALAPTAPGPSRWRLVRRWTGEGAAAV